MTFEYRVTWAGTTLPSKDIQEVDRWVKQAFYDGFVPTIEFVRTDNPCTEPEQGIRRFLWALEKMHWGESAIACGFRSMLKNGSNENFQNILDCMKKALKD